MNTLGTLYHLARADFLERIRRHSFLVVLALTVFAGYLFVPLEGAEYRVLQVGVQRGIYNSPWIGLMFGLIAATQLPLFGFYLVKNAVERDFQTGVGQIIATTPTSKIVYVVGKWLSNLAVLVSILGVMTVMAMVMQLIRAEEMTVNLWALARPIWLMGMPVLIITAALSVLFECVSFLRGGLGNIVFFSLWLGTLGVVMTSSIDEATDIAKETSDPYGYTRQLVDIQGQMLAGDPDADVGTGLIIVGKDIERTFIWDGISWKAGVIQERMMWAGLGLVIALASAIPFDRFDPARSKPMHDRNGRYPRLLKWIGTIRRGDFQPDDPIEASVTQVGSAAHLAPLTTSSHKGQFFTLLAAEIKLMLRGHSLIWYGGALGLIIACLLSPPDMVRQYLIPVLWLWPIVIWSQMGIRELRYNTEEMVFSSPHPMLRQLPAIWVAGVIITLFVGSGAWVRFALEGEITSIFAWFAGAVFVPTLALVLGVWVGNSRGFEIIYLLWWYIGVVNKVPTFDYMGATSTGIGKGIPLAYLGITVVLLALAVIGRRRQLQG